MKKYLAILLTVIPLFCFAGSHDSWSYSGKTGPEHWGSLSLHYRTCASGLHQSPINITTTKLNRKAPMIQFHYNNHLKTIINKGHTLKINVAPGNYIIVNHNEYELLQFHFHHPSEHLIDGKRYPMELHLVHRNARGAVLVIGVLIQSGKANPAIKAIWQHLPEQAQEKRALNDLKIQLSALLPQTLTTPPCSEGVSWYVMEHPITLSADGIKTFTKMFPKNARPTQALNGRVITSSN